MVILTSAVEPVLIDCRIFIASFSTTGVVQWEVYLKLSNSRFRGYGTVSRFIIIHNRFKLRSEARPTEQSDLNIGRLDRVILAIAVDYHVASITGLGTRQ